MAEEIKEEVKRGRPAKVEEVKVDKVAKALATPYSNLPKAKEESPIKKVETKVILIQTPTGRLDRKTYQIFRTKRGSYRRLLKIEKGVKG